MTHDVDTAAVERPTWGYVIYDERPIMPDRWITGSDRLAHICEKSDRREVRIIYGW